MLQSYVSHILKEDRTLAESKSFVSRRLHSLLGSHSRWSFLSCTFDHELLFDDGRRSLSKTGGTFGKPSVFARH